MGERPATHRAIEAVWRIESARLVAGLVRLVRDVGLAEECAQDAFVAAIEQWARAGIPDNPGAWLTTTARRRAIDRVRRERRFGQIRDLLARDERALGAPDVTAELDDALDHGVQDDILRLIFMSCHPALSGEARAAITLRLVCGLSTTDIARAYLAPEPTIAQRIVRAKRTLAEQGTPFEVPTGPDLAPRLASVLEVVYLLFNEGYTATAGAEWTRSDLCDEALRLGRMLAAMMPAEPEVHGLVALMELQASRLHARVDADGTPILLADQDRSRWDRLLIRRGEDALARSRALSDRPGPYALQASIAACHTRSGSADETDWAQIAHLYEQLLEITPSPIVALNHAVAIGMNAGFEAGLACIDAVASDPALERYHLLPSVRGEFLRRLGRLDEARAELVRAAALTQNARERALLLERARECDAP